VSKPEDPLLKQARIEAAHAMANAIIDVINDHARTHGIDDPELDKVLLAALATVVTEIKDRVSEDFQWELADLLLNWEDDGDDT
jgi:hypothetical protein